MTEIWKMIPGFPGYEASDLGRIRSVERVLLLASRWGGFADRKFKGRILAPNINHKRGGYHYVSLGRNSQSLKIHRLVWAAFNGKIPVGKCVNHLDFNKQNNNVSNLEVISLRENSRHAAVGKRGRKINQHLSDLDIRVIRKSVRSRKMLARLFKTTEASIKSIRAKKVFMHIGEL